MSDRIKYLLDDDNIDEIFRVCSMQNCSTFSPNFDALENSFLHVCDGQFSSEDLPEAIQFLAQSVTIVRGEKMRVVLNMIPYDDTAMHLMHDARGIAVSHCPLLSVVDQQIESDDHLIRIFRNSTVQLTLGTIDDGKATPSVMLVVKNLQRLLEDSIVEFFDETTLDIDDDDDDGED